MNGSRSATLLLALLLGCTDSLAPPSRTFDARPLALPEYARQLRGDPFLKNVVGLLGRPQLVDAIDVAVTGLDQSHSTASAATTRAIQSARLSLDVIGTGNTPSVVTERDVLNAVLAATLERIDRVNEEASASSSSSDPPPTR